KESPKCTVSLIAQRQGGFKTAISNRINKLKHLDLISIQQGEDKREKSVLLTEKGLSLVSRTEDIIYETFSRKLSSHLDRKSTRLNSSHVSISYAVFCLKKK